MSAQTSMFKTNDQLVRNHNETNKGFGIKSDHYSDSEYVERSQKFSTITDGKFFKQDPQIVNNEDLNNGQDEI